MVGAGAVHDSRILRSSPIPRTLRNSNALLLGDSGYSLSPFLMTPYRNPSNSREMAYNRVFVKERVVIERVFGQLKQRCSILNHQIRVKITNVPDWIIALCVLHNVSKRLQDCWQDECDVRIEDRDGDHFGEDNSDGASRSRIA